MNDMFLFFGGGMFVPSMILSKFKPWGLVFVFISLTLIYGGLIFNNSGEEEQLKNEVMGK